MTKEHFKPSKKPRADIPRAVEVAVLRKSARKCAFCFGLEKDTRTKRGQIAHINHNPADCRERNLAWLCLAEHHDVYDSTTRLSKNLTPGELRHYKKLLEAWVRNEMPSLDQQPTTLQEKLLRAVLGRHLRKAQVFLNTGGSQNQREVIQLHEILDEVSSHFTSDKPVQKALIHLGNLVGSTSRSSKGAHPQAFVELSRIQELIEQRLRRPKTTPLLAKKPGLRKSKPRLRVSWCEFVRPSAGKPLFRLLLRNDGRDKIVITDIRFLLDSVQIPWLAEQPCFSSNLMLEGRYIPSAVLMPATIGPDGECVFLRHVGEFLSSSTSLKAEIRFHEAARPSVGSLLTVSVQLVDERGTEPTASIPSSSPRIELKWVAGGAGNKPRYEIVMTHFETQSLHDLRVFSQVPAGMGLAIPAKTGGWYQSPSLASPCIARSQPLHPEEPWVIAHLRPVGGAVPGRLDKGEIHIEVFARDQPKISFTLPFDPEPFMRR